MEVGKGKDVITKLDEDEERIISLTKLGYTWVIWENWQRGDTAESEKDYISNMQQIAEFDNLVSFWQLWNTIPHANPSNYFMDCENLKQKQYHQFLYS
jgi:hypothetical protein